MTASIDALPSVKGSVSKAAVAGTTSPPAVIDALQGADFRDVPRDADHGDAKGAMVTRLEPGSAADRAGLHPGDIVTAVNRTPVGSAAELTKVLRQEQGRIALNVQRGDAQTYLLVR